MLLSLFKTPVISPLTILATKDTGTIRNIKKIALSILIIFFFIYISLVIFIFPINEFQFLQNYKTTIITLLLIVLAHPNVYSGLSFCSSEMVNPHSFVSKPLKSEINITEIVTEVNTLLPQLANFINQFNMTVTQSGINVMTDSMGSMSIDVPHDMTDEAAKKVSSRIGIIDRLITTRGQEINELLQKGIHLEKKLKLDDPNYVSQLTDKIQEFKRLNSLYKH
uniref:cytochrome c oxidase subunit 1 n=1 Tax=Edenia gomezpompae TaxID=461172 RepID=UPI001D123B83|nr:cytochrome c oxidase subunit 1 [Edenia gomezpompae]UAJ48647.1 cytochrome c oxidase subunit 1 [Edenia gomezpompae]